MTILDRRNTALPLTEDPGTFTKTCYPNHGEGAKHFEPGQPMPHNRIQKEDSAVQLLCHLTSDNVVCVKKQKHDERTQHPDESVKRCFQ